MRITVNKKASHDYFLEDTFEAGIVLEGWEVKAIRQNRCHLKEAYIIVKNNEVWLLGMHVTPLASASTHNKHDPIRTSKLLLNATEIKRLIGKVERAGYALVPLDLHFSRGRVKLNFALGKGKKQYDKRADIAERDWNREKQRLLKEKLR